jgi:hypothetical protein
MTTLQNAMYAVETLLDKHALTVSDAEIYTITVQLDLLVREMIGAHAAAPNTGEIVPDAYTTLLDRATDVVSKVHLAMRGDLTSVAPAKWSETTRELEHTNTTLDGLLNDLTEEKRQESALTTFLDDGGYVSQMTAICKGITNYKDAIKTMSDELLRAVELNNERIEKIDTDEMTTTANANRATATAMYWNTVSQIKSAKRGTRRYRQL